MHPRYSIYFILYSLYDSFYKSNDLFISQLLIMISGIIYHNNYNYFLRIIDISIVLYGLYLHIYAYLYVCVERDYYFIMNYVIGITCYILGLIYNSHLLHCGVHIFPSIGNIQIHKCY